MGKAKSRIPEHIVTAPAGKAETCETGDFWDFKMTCDHLKSWDKYKIENDIQIMGDI